MDIVAQKLLCKYCCAVGELLCHWIEFLVSPSQWGLAVDMAVDGVTAMDEDWAKEVEHSLATHVSSLSSLDLMSFSG